MKVAIITCHTPQNYGAMLQSYGLQTYLEKQNCDVEIIDYAPDIYFEEQSFFYVGNTLAKSNPILGLFYLLYMLPKRVKRRYVFNNFKKKYLHVTPKRYKSIEQLYLYPPIADQYICGSDQIWNSKGTRGFNPVFYLGFVSDLSKRNSYAASMSVDLPISERILADIIPHINSLDLISVRESGISQLLQTYVSKPIIHVLDPVYLLDQNQWLKLANSSKPIKEDYILIYPMGENSKTYENAEKLSVITGLPVFCITASNKKRKGIQKCFSPTISGFLQLFKCARYVITDSFHGTSFSIIFQKTFWSCQTDNNNNRITSLLQSLGLFERYIANGEEKKFDITPLNYQSCACLLEEKINISKNFITKILLKS